VTAYDDPVDVIQMPKIDRGVAVAYCDPPGPLETAQMPTFVAASPTPRDWAADRVRSAGSRLSRSTPPALPAPSLSAEHRSTSRSQVTPNALAARATVAGIRQT
jgi:hypothetical protein